MRASCMAASVVRAARWLAASLRPQCAVAMALSVLLSVVTFDSYAAEATAPTSASASPSADTAAGTSAASVAQQTVWAPIPLVQPIDRGADLAALRRGAQMYATYCVSCHAASSVRIGQLQALGFSREELLKTLSASGSALSAPLAAAMPASAAVAAFGAVPPDLALIVQRQGAPWVYTYLRAFYTDPTRPMGGNNLLVPNVAMPDILAGLHGPRLARFKISTVDSSAGGPAAAVATKTFDGFTSLAPGSMSAAQYDAALSDLVAYMGWMSDPSALTRHRLGPWVLGFLALFCLSAWGLVRAYWRVLK
ncbi:cytochrome c1 [Robbsia sp. KACC 23696]|uniref:cytochrome c1 n=1 Tax=Robbsia sp. KACC 23696 TaxID=3149231 RepID=UPI00325BBF82